MEGQMIFIVAIAVCALFSWRDITARGADDPLNQPGVMNLVKKLLTAIVFGFIHFLIKFFKLAFEFAASMF